VSISDIDMRATVPIQDKSGAASPRDVVRVALVQTHSELGTETFDPRDRNLERALSLIEAATSGGADLIVFGEMYLSGYRTDEWLHRWASVISPPDRHVRALMEAAVRHRVHLIVGMSTFGASMPGDLYNTAVLFGPKGIIGAYRKTHVAAFPYSQGIAMERCFYSPGRDLPVFETELGRIGIHICYDISFPEVARVQALRGADFLVNVSASAAGFEAYWDHMLFVRAAENAIWYMVCSVVGIQRGDRLFGGSRVVAPSGKVIAAGKVDEEDMVTAELDLAQMRSVRATGHTFSVRNPELYRPISEPSPYP